MRPHQPSDERLAEDILRGRVAALEGEDRALAEAMATLHRSAVSGPSPSPDAQILQVFADGVPTQEAAPAALAGAETTPSRSNRRGIALRGRLARLAGLSLAAKIALAGTAAAAASIGGAGVAGVLPGQGDDTPPAEPVEEADADVEEAEANVDRDIADVTTESGGDAHDLDITEEVHLQRERGAQQDAATREAERREETGQRDERGQSGLDEAGERTDESPDTAPGSGEEGRDRADERSGDRPGNGRPEDRPSNQRTGERPSNARAGDPPASQRTEDTPANPRLGDTRTDERTSDTPAQPRTDRAPERDAAQTPSGSDATPDPAPRREGGGNMGSDTEVTERTAERLDRTQDELRGTLLPPKSAGRS